MQGLKKINFGIIGGMGPLAGADIFLKLIRSTPAGIDAEHFNIVLEQQPICEKTPHGGEKDDLSLRKLNVFNVTRQLIRRKSDFIILSCFISHTFIKEMAQWFSVPIINMMEGLRQHVSVHHAGVRKIGVLTSNYAKKKRLFENYFVSPAHELIYPDTELQHTLLMDAVYGPKGIKAGHVTGNVIEDLSSLCGHLHQKGAELIIPGFTEIPIVHDALIEKTGLPILDSNQIYGDWAIRFSQQTHTSGSHLTIGIIGGLGPSATVDVMDKIIRNTPAKKDQDHCRMIVEHCPQIPDRTAHLLEDGQDPTIGLFTCAKKLEQRGADFIIIPCNTAHAFFDRIQKHLLIPMISMIDETVRHIQKNYPHITTVGLLATTGTVSAGVYHSAFSDTALHLVTPAEKYQNRVMSAIYGDKGIKAGFTGSEPRKRLIRAMAHIARQGAQAIILGCTELPLIFKEKTYVPEGGKPISILDPTEIISNKCVQLCFPKR